MLSFGQRYEHRLFSAGNCMFKVNNRNTRRRCEIYSKLTTRIRSCSIIFIVDFELVNSSWVISLLDESSKILRIRELQSSFLSRSILKFQNWWASESLDGRITDNLGNFAVNSQYCCLFLGVLGRFCST